MASQVLSAVLDRRPLLHVWPQWAEGGWIWVWTFTGGVCVWRVRSRWYRSTVLLFILGGLTGISVFLLVKGVWVPIFLTSAGVLAVSGAVLYGDRNLQRS
jgi:CHASE2 domain-containing sensor protein